MTDKHTVGSFDDWLAEDGLTDEVMAVVEARLAAFAKSDMSWLYDVDLSPPDGGPECIGPAVYRP